MSSYAKDSFLNSFWKVAYESHGESGLPATVASEATKRHPGSTRTSGLLCEQGCFVLRWALTPRLTQVTTSASILALQHLSGSTQADQDWGTQRTTRYTIV